MKAISALGTIAIMSVLSYGILCLIGVL